ncbi:MAG: BMP family ABC transporter substrate-binding protein, partial [Marmoricola sp.]
MRHATKIIAAAGAVALLAAGCGSKPASTNNGGTAAGGKKLNACMVLDTGGVDDRSFNQSSYAGLTAATKANPDIKGSFVPSSSQNDYIPNLTAETNKGCDTVIAVGGLMGEAVAKTAKKNPKQQYAEIDAASSGKNVYGLQYNTAQGGFLGGYLAASMSKTGKVGTYGGLNIPPVTIYMDGFWEGV